MRELLNNPIVLCLLLLILSGCLWTCIFFWVVLKYYKLLTCMDCSGHFLSKTQQYVCPACMRRRNRKRKGTDIKAINYFRKNTFL